MGNSRQLHGEQQGDGASERDGARAMNVALAVDIGGTKLEVGLVDADGRILLRERRPTNGADPWPGLASLVDDVRRRGEARGIVAEVCGTGCGGPMAPGGTEVSPLNIPGWRGFPLRAALEDLVGLPVVIDNDAKALALGEGWLGAARGHPDYIGMVVSTGVGGGIVLGGELVHGAFANAGHIGHVVVVPGGRACGCGATGCLEAEASGTSIAAITGAPAASADRPMRVRTGSLVGAALAATAAVLDLPLAVVSGSVALGFGEVFFAAAQAEIDRQARPGECWEMRVVPGGLGPDGPLVGAAALGFSAGSDR